MRISNPEGRVVPARNPHTFPLMLFRHVQVKSTVDGLEAGASAAEQLRLADFQPPEPPGLEPRMKKEPVNPWVAASTAPAASLQRPQGCTGKPSVAPSLFPLLTAEGSQFLLPIPVTSVDTEWPVGAIGGQQTQCLVPDQGPCVLRAFTTLAASPLGMILAHLFFPPHFLHLRGGVCGVWSDMGQCRLSSWPLL